MKPQSFVRSAIFAAVFILGSTPASAQASSGAGPTIVKVITHDFAFEMPDTLRAGLTTFRLRDVGREPHHLMLYRLDEGRTFGDVYRALGDAGAHPAWMHAVGGPNAVIGDAESVATLILAPGRYVAFCFIPSPDLKLHFAKGMMKLVTVTRATTPSMPLPRADVIITLSDYGFALSHPLTPGHHRIAVTNHGTDRHELILSKLAPGKTNADFVHFIEAADGPPPVQPYGGVTDMSPGSTVVMDVDLLPGRYSLLCRVRDATDGRPHDRHGMAAEVTVGGK